MQTAYDPVRIQLLSTRTAQAVDELAAIRCSDPWAADALRTVRLLRANLEDLWLPLLAQIRSSRAMITWLESTHDRIERGREMIVDWLEDHRRPDNEFARMSDDELIDFVTWFGFDALPFGDDGQLDMDDEFWSSSFTDFAEVIAERVAREPEFADRLLGLAAGSPMVGLVAGFADYPPDYLDALARRLLFRPSFFDGFDVRAGGTAAAMVLTALTDDPARCLDAAPRSRVAGDARRVAVPRRGRGVARVHHRSVHGGGGRSESPGERLRSPRQPHRPRHASNDRRLRAGRGARDRQLPDRLHRHARRRRSARRMAAR